MRSGGRCRPPLSIASLPYRVVRLRVIDDSPLDVDASEVTLRVKLRTAAHLVVHLVVEDVGIWVDCTVPLEDKVDGCAAGVVEEAAAFDGSAEQLEVVPVDVRVAVGQGIEADAEEARSARCS